MLEDYKYFHLHHFQTKLMNISGPILESKDMCAIFQKKGRKMLKTTKKGKTFENLGKNVLNLKIFLKRAGDCV